MNNKHFRWINNTCFVATVFNLLLILFVISIITKLQLALFRTFDLSEPSLTIVMAHDIPRSVYFIIAFLVLLLLIGKDFLYKSVEKRLLISSIALVLTSLFIVFYTIALFLPFWMALLSYEF